MTIKIKDCQVMRHALEQPCDRKLVALAIWCSVRWSHFTITSAYRPEDPGVHGTIPCRGLDVRSWELKDPEKLVEDVNKHWVYDPERLWLKCALYHGPPWHIHLQVHPRTKYLGG